jgi:hypothetical protein
MHYTLEIVLREQNEATSERVHHATPPDAWTAADVEDVLKTMLLAIDRRRNPDGGGGDRYVALRGFSWIVEPTPEGVVIAIEIPSGAAVAGPFQIGQAQLDGLVRRVIAAASPGRPTVH